MIGTKIQKPLQGDVIRWTTKENVFDKNGKPLIKIVNHEKPNDAPNTLSKYAECAQWCNENKAFVEDKGDFYEVVAIPEPTVEEIQERIQKQLTDAVQHVLDSKAQELNYDNCLSVCSYIDTGVAKFDAEGKAFRAWRSAVWAKGYEILAEVQEGKREIPTEEELIAELPELVIVYEEDETPKTSLDYLNSLGQ